VVAEVIASDPANEPNTVIKFRNSMLFNHSHQPSLSVPNGFDDDGLPTGLMVTGALFQDALVLRIGHTYQQLSDFHLRRPAFLS
jgi:Asp-tRNA(Asn)/Glu-tRNA(Gln) amidotransferase A subunit family amidase